MFLQSLVMGYGGLRFNDGGVSMDPLLPPNVTAMKLRGLNYADAEFDVAVGAAGARFTRRAGRGSHFVPCLVCGPPPSRLSCRKDANERAASETFSPASPRL